MAITFDFVERRNSKLRAAAQGPSGYGKTALVLLIARALAGGDPTKVYVIDSERKSVSKSFAAYTKDRKPACKVAQLESKSPQEYIDVIDIAEEQGAEVLVIDSFSHSWIGALEQVDRMGGQKFTNGWKLVSPLVSKLVDRILNFPGHVLVTMRTKADFALETNAQGKVVPKKIGMASVAREGTDYEFDVIFDMSGDGTISVSKSRCDALVNQTFTRPSSPDDTESPNEIPKIITTLKAWLDEGAPVPARTECLSRIASASSIATLQGPVKKFIGEAKTAGKLDEGDLVLVRTAYQARGNVLTAEAQSDAEVPE